MGLGDLFVGSGQTQAEANANYAAQQAQYNAALQARINAGTITPDQVAAYDANVNTGLEDQNAGALQAATQPFTNLFSTLSAIPGNMFGTAASTGAIFFWLAVGAVGFLFFKHWWRWTIVGVSTFLAYEAWQAQQNAATLAVGNLAALPGQAADLFSWQDNSGS